MGDRDRVEKVAEFVSDVVVDGWCDAVAAQTEELLDPDDWNRLFGRRRNRDCKALSCAAKDLLELKAAAHDAIGAGVGVLVKGTGGGAVEQALATSLAKKIPIPGEEQIELVARGIQLVGIAVCLQAGRRLTRCQCFVDLALSQTQDRVKDLLQGELEGLGQAHWRVSTDLPRPVVERPTV